MRILLIFMCFAFSTMEPVKVEDDDMTNFCIGSEAKLQIIANNLDVFDYAKNQNKYQEKSIHKCCIDKEKLCLFYDPCLTRNITFPDKKNENVYLAFLGGKHTHSDFSISYNSKTNKNQKLDPRVYNFSVTLNPDPNGLLWIQVTTENCAPQKLPKVLQCNKRYITAIYQTKPNNLSNCRFIKRLGKSGSIKFIVTFIAAPIATLFMIMGYIVFNKKILLKEYELVRSEQPTNNGSVVSVVLPTAITNIPNQSINVETDTTNDSDSEKNFDKLKNQI